MYINHPATLYDQALKSFGCLVPPSHRQQTENLAAAFARLLLAFRLGECNGTAASDASGSLAGAGRSLERLARYDPEDF